MVMVNKISLMFFTQVLYYLPASERKDMGSGMTQVDVVTSSTKQLAGAIYCIYLRSHEPANILSNLPSVIFKLHCAVLYQVVV